MLDRAVCVNSFDEIIRKKFCKKVLVNSDGLVRLTQVFKYLLEKVGNSEEELADVGMTSKWLTQVFR